MRTEFLSLCNGHFIIQRVIDLSDCVIFAFFQFIGNKYFELSVVESD